VAAAFYLIRDLFAAALACADTREACHRNVYFRGSCDVLRAETGDGAIHISQSETKI
jgi:hypothetical protein